MTRELKEIAGSPQKEMESKPKEIISILKEIEGGQLD
jgi:hypothetical protein